MKMRLDWLFIPALLLVLALLPLPYGYYTFLRLVVTIAAAIAAFLVYQQASLNRSWAIAFGIIAVLFNPIFPVYLDREVWAVIDLFAAATFAIGWWSISRSIPR